MTKFFCEEPECGKFFLTEAGVEAHRRTHQGLLPFICPVSTCAKSFSLKGNLKSHMQTHTSSHRIVCPFPSCKSSFTSHKRLNVHIKIRHAPGLPQPAQASKKRYPRSKKAAPAAQPGHSCDDHDHDHDHGEEEEEEEEEECGQVAAPQVPLHSFLNEQAPPQFSQLWSDSLSTECDGTYSETSSSSSPQASPVLAHASPAWSEYFPFKETILAHQRTPGSTINPRFNDCSDPSHAAIAQEYLQPPVLPSGSVYPPTSYLAYQQASPTLGMYSFGGVLAQELADPWFPHWN